MHRFLIHHIIRNTPFSYSCSMNARKNGKVLLYFRLKMEQCEWGPLSLSEKSNEYRARLININDLAKNGQSENFYVLSSKFKE